jgi:hypothetical protein
MLRLNEFRDSMKRLRISTCPFEQNTILLTDVDEQTHWYYFYWGLLIGMNYVVQDNLESESEFVALIKQRLQNLDFLDQLKDLWVGSVDDFKSSSDFEPLIQALFANNPNTAKRGFSEWLETREQNSGLSLPPSRQFAQDLLLEIRADYLEQIQLGQMKTKKAQFFQ